MKFAGSILVIAAASLMGVRAAMDLDRTYNEIKYVRQILYLLESEIQYSRAFLSEAFSKLAKMVREPYRTWFQELCVKMEDRDGGKFDILWENTIKECLDGLYLPRQEMEKLTELGQYLGTADTQVQMKYIELLDGQLDLTMKEMREELRGKKKLYHCLGIMGGLFLTILLI